MNISFYLYSSLALQTILHNACFVYSDLFTNSQSSIEIVNSLVNINLAKKPNRQRKKIVLFE